MINQPTVIEFYLKGSDDTMLILTTEAVPRAGEFISISKRTYKVERVTWAVDYVHDIFTQRLRANVELEQVVSAVATEEGSSVTDSPTTDRTAPAYRLPELVKEWAGLEPGAVTYAQGNAILHYGFQNLSVFVGPFPFGGNPEHERWCIDEMMPHVVRAFERRRWHYQLSVADEDDLGIAKYEAKTTKEDSVVTTATAPTVTEALLSAYIDRLKADR